MIKKELIVAVLATFCLTATLFLIIPIRSASLYDPILDVNHDGKIDIKDIAAVAKAYGTAGDPTVPVNVTNLPYSLQAVYGVNISWSNGLYIGDWVIPDYEFPAISVEGFSRMVVSIGVENVSAPNTFIAVNLSEIVWYTNASSYPPNNVGYFIDSNVNNYYNATIIYSGIPPLPGVSQPKAMIIETKGLACRLVFSFSATPTSPGWTVIDVYVYLRNE
jgi:hypothetical protein